MDKSPRKTHVQNRNDKAWLKAACCVLMLSGTVANAAQEDEGAVHDWFAKATRSRALPPVGPIAPAAPERLRKEVTAEVEVTARPYRLVSQAVTKSFLTIPLIEMTVDRSWASAGQNDEEWGVLHRVAPNQLACLKDVHGVTDDMLRTPIGTAELERSRSIAKLNDLCAAATEVGDGESKATREKAQAPIRAHLVKMINDADPQAMDTVHDIATKKGDLADNLKKLRDCPPTIHMI